MQKRKVFELVVVISLALVAGSSAQTFQQRLDAITGRPEFKHSDFGVAVLDLDSGSSLYGLNAEKFFVPGSTTKLLTAGTAMQLFGSDYRFHTRIYRTGEIDKKGKLKGELILVASGDPNLSNRIQPDGSLAFRDHDHSYGGSVDTQAVAGDPLTVIKALAQQVAKKGVKSIQGRVLVDATLFEEGAKELGTGMVISPIIIYDNVIDVTVGPGSTAGAAANVTISPQTPYVRFTNEAKTGGADSKPDINFIKDTKNPDGTRTVTITGSVPLGKPAVQFAYGVPEPTRYAEVVLGQALRDAGVRLETKSTAAPDFKSLSGSYTDANMVAEHISAPMSEAAKVILKVSQNLHASSMPYVLGATLGKKHERADQSGFELEHEFLTKAGLDTASAVQSDGAGGDAFYTPDFMVRYLAYMAKQKDGQLFHDALPILGRDGTLAKIQVNSPAAGHVFAKTGTYATYNALNKNLMLTGKGLAGYVTTAKGTRLAIACYLNRVQLSLDDPDAAQHVAGEALGEIASAIYQSF